MSYIVRAFGNLEVSPYLRQGDAQDIGSGSALTSFLSLPGGGFYDNYQRNKSPQGIRPISKSGLFLGTAAELRAQLDSWRALLGKRDKLTVEFDDGSLRWQWARLQDVSTPRGAEVKGGYLPFTLTWVTAAQNWRGVVNDDWTWGDDSWRFGDGSAEMGVGSYTFPLTIPYSRITLHHSGTIDAANVLLHVDISGTWSTLIVINETTGQTIEIERGITTPRPWCEIDSGARTLYIAQRAPVSVAGVYRVQNFVYVTTSGAHGLTPTTIVNGVSVGDPFMLTGCGAYDGTYYPAITQGDSSFYFIVPGDFEAYGTVTGGQMTGLFNIYSSATISDKKRWLVLAPGDNTLQINFVPPFVPALSTPTSATLIAKYVDHYG